MAAIDVGRECIKLRGRDAGAKVIVAKVLDKNFVEIKDSKGKASKCNVRHLEPLPAKA